MNVAHKIARSACCAIRQAACFGNGSYLGAVLSQSVRYGVAERKGNVIRVKKGQERLIEQAFSLVVEAAPQPKRFDQKHTTFMHQATRQEKGKHGKKDKPQA